MPASCLCSSDVAATAQGDLVDELCDDGTALDTARTLARRLAAGPSQGYAGCKAAIDAAVEHSEAQALGVARDWAVRLGFSDDLAEGLRAFEERRAPRFG